ncbi:MAG: low specificity L-threonine aldolase [Chlamydiales bacterium]|nr:low specificity L-threonine aldolase [Chlamydiales bacterium]
MKSFASDNYSGIHPAVLKRIEEVNRGDVPAYGDDPYTKKAIDLFRAHFGEECEVFFVFNGTGANVLGIKAAASTFHSVLSAETSHLNVDECGACESFTGCKLQTVPTDNGKLSPSILGKFLKATGNEHRVQPKVISISQTTELGSVYTLAEIADLSVFAKKNGLYLHMDGARLSNAAASLNASLKEISRGVDFLSFGGTKNGLMCGEAVIFFDKKLAYNFKYIRKQGMHLGSKMRFLAAQFEAFFTDELWLKNAQHANRMARKLAEGITCFHEIRLARPVEANGVFAILPRHLIEPLQKEFFFHVWNQAASEVRWMTSFDTTEEDIERFLAAIKRLSRIS